MLELNQNSLKQPYGGHHFPEKGLMIRADSFKELAVKLREFRINNNRPSGNPEQDILVFYAKNWPWLVRTPEIQPEEINEDEDYVGWRKWIYRIWDNPFQELASQKEADDRTDICKSCPHNKPMSWQSTHESTELARRAFLLRRGINKPDNIGYCGLHHADISILCFSSKPREFSGAKKDTAQPPKCWV